MRIKEKTRIKREIYKNNGGEKYISVERQLDYYRRLSIPYYKKRKKRFIYQFLEGVGGELTTKKFFESTSSSRLCFELFSWLANSDDISNIEFEYHLPPVKSKNGINLNGDNMDVFFIKNKDIYFIESKFFEEKYNKITDIPDAYYKETGSAISKRGKTIKTSLMDRYDGNKVLYELFPEYTYDLIDYLSFSKRDSNTGYFDLKQMVAHLFGICQFIYKAKEKLDGRKIYLCLIDYDFGKPFPDLALYFKEHTNIMMENYLDKLNVKAKFHMELDYVQNYVKSIPKDTLSFGTNTSIFETLKEFEIYLDKE